MSQPLWHSIPYLCILLPLGSAAVTSVLKPRWARYWTMFALLVVTSLSGVISAIFASGAESYTYMMGHFPAPWGNEIRAGQLEAVTALFFSLIMLLSLLGGLKKIDEHIDQNKVSLYYVVLLLLTAALMAQVYTNDIFTAYVFLEIMTLAACALIAIRKRGRTLVAATRYMIMNLIGSGLFLLGIILLYDLTGHLLMSNMKEAVAALAKSGQYQVPLTIVVALISIGLSIKSALFPFHTWSPDGHASAPTAVSMLHAGVLMKLGGYGCFRVAMYLMPEAAHELSWIFIILTTISVVYGAFSACVQTDLKYINAYSSVSHCGLVLFAILMMNTTAGTGAILQMLSHGLMTALFFALIGMIYGRTHTRDIRQLGGLMKVMPFLAVGYVIAGLANLGLPGLSGFVAEMTIFNGAFMHADTFHRVVTVVACTSIVITAVYILRVVGKILYGTCDNPGHLKLTDATWDERLSVVCLVAAIAGMGLVPLWVSDMIRGSVSEIIAHILS